ncbi:MAG: ABC transporter substrate-binding protein [Rhodoferax sp.]
MDKGHPGPVGTGAPFILLERGQRDDLSGVLHRIETSSDIVVYRMEAGASELLLAQLSRSERPAQPQASDASRIAVLYPDLDEPYRGIFAKIIEGVEAQLGAPVLSYPIGSATAPKDVVAHLKRQNIGIVIALGRQGMKAASELERDVGVIAGGVVSPPEGEGRSFPLVSLAPDPKVLFDRLRQFMPEARRVIVVYDPKKTAWLIRLARDAARSLGLELQAIEVTDLKAAVRAYQELLVSADSRRDALWLPQDSTTVEDSSVLPLILESAWNRNLVVFSSSVSHVKRGALFSLYPDNIALGRQLAASAQSLLNGGAATVVPMKDALLAVNVRTASHLGLQLSTRQQGFDLVFPAR